MVKDSFKKWDRVNTFCALLDDLGCNSLFAYHPRSTRSGHWFYTYWHLFHTPQYRSEERCSLLFHFFQAYLHFTVTLHGLKTHLRSAIECTLILHSLWTWDSNKNQDHLSIQNKRVFVGCVTLKVCRWEWIRYEVLLRAIAHYISSPIHQLSSVSKLLLN